MAGPGAVLILHLQDFAADVAVPLLPLVSAGASQAVADIQVGEKFLAAHGAVSGDAARVGKLILNRADLSGVLLPVGVGAAELFELLRFLVERDAGGCGGN